jgi:hypothetical protein
MFCQTSIYNEKIIKDIYNSYIFYFYFLILHIYIELGVFLFYRY